MPTTAPGMPSSLLAAPRALPKVRLSEHGFSILQIETLLACNMACDFCAYPLLEDKGARLESETVVGLLDQIDPDDPGLEYVCLSHYNEPLLDDRIYDFIGEAKKRGLKVLIITNGLAFRSQEVIDRLLDAAPDLLKISYQTASPSRFYASRGTRISYEKYALSVSAFLAEAVRRDSPTMITLDFACNFLTPLSRFARHVLGVERGDSSVRDEVRKLAPYMLDVLESIGREVPELSVEREDAKRYLSGLERDYLEQESLELSDHVSLKVKRFIHGRRLSAFRPAASTVPCGTRILSVLANGSVVPCCLAHEGLLSMGDATAEALSDVLERGRPLIESVQSGVGMPDACRVCQGAPSRRGALVLSGLRAYRKRPVFATSVTALGGLMLGLAAYAAHPATPALVDIVHDAYLVVTDFLHYVLDYHISPRLAL